MMKYYFILLFNSFTVNAFSQNNSPMELAQHLHYAYDLDGHKDRYLFDKAEKVYREVLSSDSLNIDAMYGLWALYYNESVYISNDFKDSKLPGDKKELKKASEKVDYYFSMAEPLLEKYKRLKAAKEKK